MTAKGLTVPELPSRTIIVLVVAVFVVALGYGVVLPVLPAIVAKVAGTGDAAAIARHLGYLSAVYAAGPLVAAIAWGRLSDARGRTPIIMFALWGFAITLAATAFAPTLFALYVGRALNGLFAAAVSPTVLALIADFETNDDRRARLFGRVSMASIAGFFLGPMLGGIAAHWGAGVLLPGAGPFLLVAALSGGLGVVVALIVADHPTAPPRQAAAPPASSPQARWRILVLTGIVACGLGALEVGVAMRTGPRALTPEDLAILFAGCSVIMFVMQGIIFSRWVRVVSAMPGIAPALAVMALGLALVPVTQGLPTVFVALALVSASAGMAGPLLGYWMSRVSGAARGAGLGKQSAVASLGQTLGSAGIGALYGVGGTEWAAFLVPATVVLVGGMLAISLPRVLAKAGLPVIHASTHRADLGQGQT